MKFYQFEETTEAYKFYHFKPGLKFINAGYLIAFWVPGIVLWYFYTYLLHNAIIGFVAWLLMTIFVIQVFILLYFQFKAKMLRAKLKEARDSGKTIKITGKRYSPDFQIEISK